MSCVLMHVSYCYYTRKFAAQCEVGEQCRARASRLKRTALRLPHCRGVTRLFLNGGSCSRGVLMEFLACNRFCAPPRVYLGLTTEMKFYQIRGRRLRFNIEVIRCSPATRAMRPRNYLDVFHLQAAVSMNINQNKRNRITFINFADMENYPHFR